MALVGHVIKRQATWPNWVAAAPEHVVERLRDRRHPRTVHCSGRLRAPISTDRRYSWWLTDGDVAWIFKKRAAAAGLDAERISRTAHASAPSRIYWRRTSLARP